MVTRPCPRRYYGLLAERFSKLNRKYSELFCECFVRQYQLIHRYVGLAGWLAGWLALEWLNKCFESSVWQYQLIHRCVCWLAGWLARPLVAVIERFGC
jgi:hypothetical protein